MDFSAQIKNMIQKTAEAVKQLRLHTETNQSGEGVTTRSQHKLEVIIKLYVINCNNK
jgi:hypothetical protein